MQIITYQPLLHYSQVAALWECVLGETYPVSERVLFPRIVGRNTLEPGDGLVVLDGDHLVGFGLLEIDRGPICPGRPESVQALLVDPDWQRQGIGSKLLNRLEGRLRALGVTNVIAGGGPWRFWTGVPEDLPAAAAFFAKHGYTANYEAIDLCGPLAEYTMPDEAKACLAAAGAEVAGCTPDDVGPAYDFLTREQPGWRGSFLAMVTAGDMANMLLVKHGAEIVGCIQTYPRHSRYRGANVVWERLYSPDLGGFGAVLIAKDWRGQGLGVAMIQAAAQYVKDSGASHCYIDWTSRALAPFYGKVGTEICKVFTMYGKALG
ncbi:MAG: GNAT family N-acetyltransferase [Armatimonadota bacterium]